MGERERERIRSLSLERGRSRRLCLSLERSRRLSFEWSLFRSPDLSRLLSRDLSRRLSFDLSLLRSFDPSRLLSLDESRGFLYGSGEGSRLRVAPDSIAGFLGARSLDAFLGFSVRDLLLERRPDAIEGSLLA